VVKPSIGIVMLPPSEFLCNAPNYWSPQCLSALPSSERIWTKHGKIIDAGHTTYYILNSGVTEPNLTKFLHSTEIIVI